MFRSRQFWHSTNGPMPSGFREANPPHNVRAAARFPFSLASALFAFQCPSSPNLSIKDACDLRVNLVWKPGEVP
jgi:hypothetical protein